MSYREAKIWSWLFGILAMSATGVLAIISEISEAADVAQKVEKLGSSALLAAVAVAAVWALVKIHNELLDQGTKFIKSIDELKQELAGRPCFYEHKDRTK